MQNKLFGTDGIRGIWKDTISPELAFLIGKAASKVFERKDEKNIIVIGKDTRLSCDSLVSAISSGLTACGIDVVFLGVVPTALVPFAIKQHKAVAGIMITASHNPAEHNGIKFFNGNGYKISEEQERKIEYILNFENEINSYNKLGKIEINTKSIENYIKNIKKLTKNAKKIKICFDVANGCATEIVKKAFNNFDITLINNNPDGLNTNLNCGANHVEVLSQFMKNKDFDIGFSFDGDADRVNVCLKNGEIISSEEIIYFLTKYYSKKQVVLTVMANSALADILIKEGVDVKIGDVGEKPVLTGLLENNFTLGCENNGHYILLDENTTSDGIISAAKIINIFDEIIMQRGKYKPYYQTLTNVPVNNKNEVMQSEVLKNKIELCESLILETGRILVRPSGTESVVRVLVECENKSLASEISLQLVQTIKQID
ncbi:MAG: hypothetical protein J5779_01885 [Clostridia bacterium]|nr:hypothetical protein [Clostridia bacterium]